MAIPTLNPLPVPPTQATPEQDWPDMADATVTAEYNLVLQLNAETIPGINSAVESINSAALESGQNAQAAQTSAGEASNHKQAAQESAEAAATSEGNASASAGVASGAATAAGQARDQAEQFRGESEGFRDEARQFRDEAQAIVIGDAIDDTAISGTQVRSSLNDSIGNFRNVAVNADAAIGPLDFAQITATAAAVTVTLPADPLEGQLFMIGNLTARRDHRIAVGAIPVKGQASGGFILIDKPNITITLKYTGPVYGLEVMQ